MLNVSLLKRLPCPKLSNIIKYVVDDDDVKSRYYLFIIEQLRVDK